MDILDAAEVGRLLSYEGAAAELRAVLELRREGRAVAPVRTSLPLAAGGVLLLMPATDGRLAVTKVVTVHPGNAAHGLPATQASVLALDAATGRPLALLDGAAVTARRTAALSALAARLLAPNPVGPALIVGAGAQGRAHLEAFHAMLGVREFVIASRGEAGAQRLIDYGRARGLAMSLARGAAEISQALARAPLAVTATGSATPVLGDEARPDAFIAAVGAFAPEMAELPPALVRRARLFVDTLDGARQEAGDLIQAGVDWAEVTPLERAIELPRPAAGPVIFKSVGDALWDLAAVRAVLGAREG